MAHIRRGTQFPDLVDLYLGGMSEKALADRFGCSRGPIRQRLLQAGVKPRGRSDAERAKWSAMKGNRARVVQQCHAAWAAARGRQRSVEEKRRSAVTNFLRQTRRGRHEDRLAAALKGLGLKATQQFPIDCYCIDVALEESRLAVEVLSNWPKPQRAAAHRQRMEHILNAGWSILWINATGRIPFDMAYVCQHVLAYAERARGNQATGRGQYWVIRSDRKTATGLGRYLHRLTGIEPAGNDKDVTGYERAG